MDKPIQAETHAAAATMPLERALKNEQMFRQQMGRISRQSSVFFAGTIFTTAAGYFFRVYVARVLGAEALGTYALGMTVVGFFGIFSGLGLPQSALRFVSAYTATNRLDDLRGFLARSFSLLLLTNAAFGGCVLFLGPWLAANFYHDPALRSYLSLFVVIMVVGAISTFAGQALAGYKDVARRTLITSFIGSPLNIILAVWLIGLGYGLRGYILAQVFAGAVVALLLVLTAWQRTPVPARKVLSSFPSLDPDVVPFAAAAFGLSFLEFVMSQADKVLIGFYLNAREVGIYAVAASLVAFVSLILQSVNQIFSPTIADLHARGEMEVLGRLYQTLTKWILGMTLPLAAVMMVFAVPMMRIFGQDFAAGWGILIVGTVGQLINCATGSVGYLLMMSGNQRQLIKVQSTMALFIVMASLLLIPSLGIIGAALAAALTNAISNGWYLYEVRRRLGFVPYNRGYFGLLIPVVTMIVTLLFMKYYFAPARLDWLRVMGALVAGYTVFVATALLVGLDEDDRLIARTVWSRIGSAWQLGVS